MLQGVHSLPGVRGNRKEQSPGQPAHLPPHPRLPQPSLGSELAATGPRGQQESRPSHRKVSGLPTCQEDTARGALQGHATGASCAAPTGFQVEVPGVLSSPASGLSFPPRDHRSPSCKRPGKDGTAAALPGPPAPVPRGPRVREVGAPAPGPRPPPPAGRPTHHPPHLGRHVVAELPFDRGLSWLAGHGGPGHLHARPGAQAAGAPHSERSAGRAGRRACGSGQRTPMAPRRALPGGVEGGPGAQLGSARCGERRAGREGCGGANLRHAGPSPPRGHPQPQEAVAGRARVCVRARAAATSRAWICE